MQCSNLVRRAAVATVAVGLMVGGASVPSVAAAKAKPTLPAKVAKVSVVKFTAAGTVTSVGADAMTVTLDYKGGNQRPLKGTPLTVSVPSTATVTRNGAPATLADVQVGDHVAIQGVKASGAYVASKVHVDAPVVVEEPAPTV